MAKKRMKPVVVEERDLPILRLAGSTLGRERDLAYEDLAEVYGDEHLFAIADSLRERNLVGWGTIWNHCWLTEEGLVALNAHSKKAAA